MKRTFLSLAAAVLVVAADPVAAQTEAAFAIVVNASNPVSALPTSAISQLFLKKATWATGDPVEPVDLTADSRIRRAFTSIVHRKTVGSVKSYWQQQIFSGRAVPPPEKESEADVIEFVRSNPSAIGYVSAAADLGVGVKILAVVTR